MTKSPLLSYRTPPEQRGTTLIVSLLMLLMLLILSITMNSLTLMEIKSARNDGDRKIALQAAELALADAHADITNSPDSMLSRSAIFSASSNAGFTANCHRGDTNRYQGLCDASASEHHSGITPHWLAADIADDSTQSVSVHYGRFTGKTMPAGTGAFPAKLPRYLIELIPDTQAGKPPEVTYLYRITAIGFGSDANSQVVLQSIYRKENEHP